MDKQPMTRQATMLFAAAARPESLLAGSLALRADRLDAVHRRIRFVALLLLFAFIFDPVVHTVLRLSALFFNSPLPSEMPALLIMDKIGLSAALVSLAVWWAARGPRLHTAHLVVLSLFYEVGVCFVVSLLTFWHFFLATGVLPQITWVIGIIILFPLIVPAPPKQILLAAVASAIMPALALMIMTGFDLVQTPVNYAGVTVNHLLATVFAYLSARVVHGLNREAAAFRELGSYRLEVLLGQGGMGEIWRARHQLLVRPAAIKLIRQHYVKSESLDIREETLRRFEREAQVIASLRSPHTVTLFDFGVSTDGDFYYVMELLDGLDADALVRRFGPQPAERVIYLLSQVCHSLAEAEARNVVHRDIKPANIFICRYGEEYDFVKVLDFGLAHLQENAQTNSDTLPRQNTVCGTPAFMSPEQASVAAALDIRTDIYAVGCVAYWLLTGETVFAADTASGQIAAHLRETPAPPSARIALPVPSALDKLILDCLEKEPRQRPQKVQDMLERLRQIEIGAWSNEHARQWWAQSGCRHER